MKANTRDLLARVVGPDVHVNREELLERCPNNL